MWWSDRLSSKVVAVALVVAATGLSGCGYRPLYAKGGTAEGSAAMVAELGGVRVDQIDDRLGQELRNALLVRLSPQGEPANHRYSLSIKLNRSEGGLGFRKDTFATMAELRMDAVYVLTDEDEGVSHSGAENSVVSFDYLGPRYASIAMERDANSRAVTELADRIANRVAMALSGQLKWRKPGERSVD